MSEQFNVGDVCVTQNADRYPEFNGVEVTVVAVYDGQIYMLDLKEPSTGLAFLARDYQLRKKRPPEANDAAAHQAMLDCIERSKIGQGVTA